MTAVNSPSISRVMYVEDDPDIRAIAEIALQDVGGFEIALCESGAVAVETAQHNVVKYRRLTVNH